MKQRWHSVRREDGQALIIMALALVVMLGFAGLVVDIGRAYLAQRQLQTGGRRRCARSAGSRLPNSTAAQTPGARLQRHGSPATRTRTAWRHSARP